MYLLEIEYIITSSYLYESERIQDKRSRLEKHVRRRRYLVHKCFLVYLKLTYFDILSRDVTMSVTRQDGSPLSRLI